MKNFTINLLKGKMAENIAIFHFEQMGFKVVRTGKEELFPKELVEFASYDNQKFQNSSVFSTFQIYNEILSKLPDLLIYKKNSTGFMIKFVEVKYRKDLEEKKIKNFIVSSDEKDILDIKKYLNNLNNLNKLLKFGNNWPDVYVYLITKKNIYFGKVYNKKNYYLIDFLTPEEVERRYSKNWPRYKEIAENIKHIL